MIKKTRLTVPIETVRAASVSETYIPWLKNFDESDEFLQKCVNNGVPLRTSCAIDESVIQVLIAAGVKPDVPAMECGTDKINPGKAFMIWDVQRHMHRERAIIRSFLVDTGATGSLSFTDVESYLKTITPHTSRSQWLKATQLCADPGMALYRSLC